MKAKMTQKRFWELLESRAKKRKFVCESNGDIRERFSGYCPILAVAKQLKLSMIDFDNGDFCDVGDMIGIGKVFVSKVVAAADDDDCEVATNKIRQKILTACRIGLA